MTAGDRLGVAVALGEAPLVREGVPLGVPVLLEVVVARAVRLAVLEGVAVPLGGGEGVPVDGGVEGGLSQ